MTDIDCYQPTFQGWLKDFWEGKSHRFGDLARDVRLSKCKSSQPFEILEHMQTFGACAEAVDTLVDAYHAYALCFENAETDVSQKLEDLRRAATEGCLDDED